MRIPFLLIPILTAVTFLNGCSSSSNDEAPPPEYDFSAVGERFQQFLDESEVFDGISVTLVEQEQGVVYEAAFGDHTLDIVVMLASTSKMPVTSTLMAISDDETLDYDIAATIDNYLPWDGVYGDRTTVQLVSNTSGIPGLSSLGIYGIHLCQYSSAGSLEICAESIYTTELAGTQAPGTGFDYGGSQWQLAGAVAEQVTNSTWRQLFGQYIAMPCELEVFQFGNMWADVSAFDGSADSLVGLDNPNIEGGAITNMSDYAKILLMHLNGGKCGDTQVMNEESVAFLQVDRGGEFGTPYGMGWWIVTKEDGSAPTVFYDPGAFGAISWLDIERGIGGYVAIDDYSRVDSGAPITLVLEAIIPLVEQAVDEARAAVSAVQ